MRLTFTVPHGRLPLHLRCDWYYRWVYHHTDRTRVALITDLLQHDPTPVT